MFHHTFQTFLQHIANAIRRQGGARYGINLCFRVCYFLYNRNSNAVNTVLMKFLSDELLLPRLGVLNFCTKSGRLALMVELNTINSIKIILQSNKATDTTPETHTFQWEYMDVLTIYFTIVV